jgi:hypothetical protein
VSQLAAIHLDIKGTRNSNEVTGIFRPVYDISLGRSVPVSSIPFLVIFLNSAYDLTYNPAKQSKKCAPNVASHSKWSILMSRGLGSSLHRSGTHHPWDKSYRGRMIQRNFSRGHIGRDHIVMASEPPFLVYMRVTRLQREAERSIGEVLFVLLF